MVGKKIVYIGEFPPPFGGVTTKNRIVYDYIFKNLDAEFIDIMECKRSPLKVPIILIRIIRGMLFAHTVVLGTGARWRDKTLLWMQRCLTGRKGLKKIMKLVMGGRYHEFVEQDLGLRRLMLNVGSIWVESEKMIEEFRNLGMERVFLFPNCRVEDAALKPIEKLSAEPLKLVFFSKICDEKGVDIIMKAYDIWNTKKASVTLDFYGEISEDIRGCFEKFIGGGGRQFMLSWCV